jgi:8-oxo-dGTP pyrophosphatase MutT (NUDIX family)
MPKAEPNVPIVRDPERPYLVEINPDYVEYQLPVSVKAVISWGGLIPLLKNERDEWELPGGKLEVGEDPAACLAREIEEELGWEVNVCAPFHCWVYRIRPDRHVFVVTYFASYEGSGEPRYSNEHKSLRLVRPDGVGSLEMPQPYKDSIALAFQTRGT